MPTGRNRKALFFFMKTSNYFKSLFVIISILLSLDLQAQVVSKTVNVQTAGTLNSLIPTTDKYQITSLTVTGFLNGTDIRYIREMAGRDVNGRITLGKLSVLDLSGANIVAGGSNYFYDHTTSLNEIGYAAFDQCTGLTSIIIPNSVTSIGNAAFYHCTGLTSIAIPNSVTSIGDNAFDSCLGLTSITIPNSVTSIGISAFNRCTKLKEFIVSENNTAYSSVQGVLFSKDCTKLIAYPNAKTNIYTLPNSVTSIGNYAFEGCTELASIGIPNSVTSIGSYAFYNCRGLASITIPNSVTSIGSFAFYYCTGLASITIPYSVISIEGAAFAGCTKLEKIIVSENNPAYSSVEGVLFSKDCTKLIAYPYAKSNIYTLPNSVTSIGDYAFYNCTGLTSVTIGNGVTSIGDYAFYNCIGLASITIPNSVTFIGSFAFRYCTGLASITIPYSVILIGDYAFYGCTRLTSTTIPNSVTFIGNYAFAGCEYLTSITIPNSVTTIGNSAFQYCTRITEIHSKILTPQNVDSSVFYAINKTTCKLYVPKGTYSKYFGATGWRDFTNIIEEEATAVSQIEKSNVKVYIDQDAITVTGADLGDNISVYTESGALLQTIKVKDNTIRITVPLNKIYLIKTAGKVFKVAL